MTAICAKETAGVDVKLSMRITTLDASMGGKRSFKASAEDVFETKRDTRGRDEGTIEPLCRILAWSAKRCLPLRNSLFAFRL